jgi:hypothetical protein
VLKPISAVLWRRCNQATFDTLNGNSSGQYDIRLAKGLDFREFFRGISPVNHTNLGGYTLEIPIQAFDGEPPVTGTELIVRFIGEKSERKDWYIPSQRPATAYELWRPGRGVGAQFNVERPEYLVLIRDYDDAFHARWISSDSISKLPIEMQQLLSSNECGVRTFI